MTIETKPQSGNTGAGARAGNAGHAEQGRDASGTGERGGRREENTFDRPKRGPAETKPPPPKRP